MGKLKKAYRYYKKYVHKNDTVSLTYYLILAVIPAVTIFLFITKLAGVDNKLLIDSIHYAFNEDLANSISNILLDRSSTTASVITLCICLVISSQGAYRMILTVDKMYHIRQEMSLFSLQFHAIFDTLLIMLLVLATIIFLGVLPSVLKMVHLEKYVFLLRLFAFVCLYIMLVVIYKVVPSIRVRIRDTLFGAFCTAVLFIVISICFNIYLSIVNMSNVYGSFAFIALLLLSLEFYAQALYFGFAVNALKYVE